MFNEAYSFTVVYLGLRQITHPLPAVLLCVSSERDLGYNSEDRVIKHLSHFPCFSLCLAIVLRKNEEVLRQYSEYVHLKISLLIVFHVGCLVPVWCIMGIVSSEILTEKKKSYLIQITSCFVLAKWDSGASSCCLGRNDGQHLSQDFHVSYCKFLTKNMQEKLAT